MFVESSSTTIRGKTYTRHLLRRSYREDGKIKHETLGNVSRGTPEEIEAIRLALKHKGRLAQVLEARPAWRTRQGLSIGALWTVLTVARRLGIDAALGPTRSGRLALWQVVARVLDQGSRLSAVRLAGSHAACEALSLEAFNEEDLYPNLDWLAEKQPAIEARLFRSLRPSIEESGLFLYDVTSSYLEGTQNELAAFGYNSPQVYIPTLPASRGMNSSTFPESVLWNRMATDGSLHCATDKHLILRVSLETSQEKRSPQRLNSPGGGKTAGWRRPSAPRRGRHSHSDRRPEGSAATAFHGRDARATSPSTKRFRFHCVSGRLGGCNMALIPSIRRRFSSHE